MEAPRAGFGPPSPAGRDDGGLKPALPILLRALALTPTGAAAQAPSGLGCAFPPILEVGQPARNVEIRFGPWADPLGLFEDDDRVPLWVEGGEVTGPIWPTLPISLTSGLTMTVQSTPSDGVANLMSWRSDDGQALLSTHAAASDPSQIMWSNAVGTCALVEADCDMALPRLAFFATQAPRTSCALFAIMAALAPAAHAEGARQTFDCRATLACDGAGACEPADAPTLLTVAPVAVAPDGSGSFTIAYDDITADMTSPTPLGPFLWSETGSDAQVLLLTGETTLLWHSLNPATGASAVRFLACEVTR